ncbi:hypothetical protein PIIN_05612 [Serendipita indica DSM 11827]|uniref:Uncharacterized protein n=1 Tax=Serendipita indica (strain DSM 11827) TaxID=1109443 RepID=G4TK34_SERID|nr:hypothetical protein PIIN_05612 [Serendipita indica DSM 11827]
MVNHARKPPEHTRSTASEHDAPTSNERWGDSTMLKETLGFDYSAAYHLYKRPTNISTRRHYHATRPLRPSPRVKGRSPSMR